MIEFSKHQVYDKVPTEECYRVTGKAPIGTRWVDVKKGDDVNPEVRSRLVAQHKKSREINVLTCSQPLRRWKRKRCCLAWQLRKGLVTNKVIG